MRLGMLIICMMVGAFFTPIAPSVRSLQVSFTVSRIFSRRHSNRIAWVTTESKRKGQATSLICLSYHGGAVNGYNGHLFSLRQG